MGWMPRMRHKFGRNGDGGIAHDANGSRYHRLMVPYKLDPSRQYSKVN